MAVLRNAFATYQEQYNPNAPGIPGAWLSPIPDILIRFSCSENQGGVIICVGDMTPPTAGTTLSTPSQCTRRLLMDKEQPLLCYFEGKIIPLSEAKVGILTHGFSYGTACFEGIRA